MIEEKSEEEIAGENEGSSEQKAVESIDESDNMRTVIANIEGFEEFQRFQVDITRDLNYLVDFLKDKFELDGERRLKDHAAKRFFFKEEMENKLKSYETFVEGGSRIEIGLGRPTTMAEITVNVIIHKKPESFQQFYFNADITVKEAKQQICKKLSEEQKDASSELNAEKHTLFRVDAFEEPSYALRRLNQTFNKNNVSSGELLILRSDADIPATEKFKMSIHLTRSGLSDDSQYLEDVEAPKELTLDELKD